jgi:hypothetical protein
VKKIIIIPILIFFASSVAALQSGFIPCIEEAGKLRCFQNEFTPLWDSLCPKCWIDQVPIKTPNRENAFDSCGSCHSGSTKKVFILWQTKYHKKHAEKTVDCNRCHKI